MSEEQKCTVKRAVDNENTNISRSCDKHSVFLAKAFGMILMEFLHTYFYELWQLFLLGNLSNNDR